MPEDKDKLDRWIDEGVQRYVEAEPPLGMEGRVLARLEPQRRTWWRPWMIAVPLAALLAVVIGLAVQNKAGAPPKPAVGSPQPSVVSKQAPSDVARVPQQHGRPAPKRIVGGDARQGVSEIVAAPRPETFPVPAPASEQEMLLARLAQNQTAAHTVAARMAQKEEEIVISGITIKPVEIPLLPGPHQGE